MATATTTKKRYCTICKNKLEVTDLFASIKTLWNCQKHGEQKESLIRLTDIPSQK